MNLNVRKYSCQNGIYFAIHDVSKRQKSSLNSYNKLFKNSPSKSTSIEVGHCEVCVCVCVRLEYIFQPLYAYGISGDKIVNADYKRRFNTANTQCSMCSDYGRPTDSEYKIIKYGENKKKRNIKLFSNVIQLWDAKVSACFSSIQNSNQTAYRKSTC